MVRANRRNELILRHGRFVVIYMEALRLEGSDSVLADVF